MYTEILYCRLCQTHTAHVSGKCDACTAAHEQRQRTARWNKLGPREKITALRRYHE